MIYKVKNLEDGSMQLKGRIVPHGNRESERENIRKDASTAHFDVIRLLLCIVSLLGFRLGMADIKGAYLQSGPIKRSIYVRPPREWKGSRGKLWKLKKLPCGIVEVGRQWAKVIEEWMLTIGKLERVFGLSQLYVRRNEQGRIAIVVAKVTDDFIIGGKVQSICDFVSEMKKRFEVGKVVIDARFFFNGCEIEQDEEGNVTLSMAGYIKQLKDIALSRARRKQRDEKATEAEISMFRSVTGTLLWLGKGVLPPAAYACSALQQKIVGLRVSHLMEANTMIREILKLNPMILFRRPESIEEAIICTFSDAAYNISSAKSYGQSGIFAGLSIKTAGGLQVYHAIDWSSTKQRRICHSSYGAEIIACADGDDRGFHLRGAFRSLFPYRPITNELQVDSHGLYDTITTLHEGHDYRLRQTVQRIRNSFEAEEIDVLRWIPGRSNVADALTKIDVQLWKLINDMCVSGRLVVEFWSRQGLAQQNLKIKQSPLAEVQRSLGTNNDMIS